MNGDVLTTIAAGYATYEKENVLHAKILQHTCSHIGWSTASLQESAKLVGIAEV
jgi:hypothetical protein